LSQKLIVKKNHGSCPCCNTTLRVITPKTGEGSVDHYPKIQKITEGYKREIIDAYMRSPENEYTTIDIINRMNFARYSKGNTKIVQRCNITRAHGELVGRKIINKVRKEGDHFIFKINAEKANALLNGELS